QPRVPTDVFAERVEIALHLVRRASSSLGRRSPAGLRRGWLRVRPTRGRGGRGRDTECFVDRLVGGFADEGSELVGEGSDPLLDAFFDVGHVSLALCSAPPLVATRTGPARVVRVASKVPRASRRSRPRAGGQSRAGS